MSKDRYRSDKNDARWIRLNAFVDGELDGAQAAETARELADDPALARQTAALGDMKEALVDAIPAPSLVPPEQHHAIRRSGSMPRRLAIGAVAAVLLVVTVLGWTAMQGSTPGWAEVALAQHRALSALPKATVAEERVATYRANGSGFIPFIPNLDSGRLWIAHIAKFKGPSGNDGLAVHYRGTRGCKLTLVALRDGAEGAAETLAEWTVGDTRSYRWRVGAVRYQLFATGMEPGRLELIARTTHSASQLHQQPDADARARLAEARARSAPCRA